MNNLNANWQLEVHTQLGVFWIATAFLAAGLFLAPAIGGREPRFQRLGVNVLFVALLVVVSGSLAGEYLAIHQKLGLDASFWFGHQGYEYVDLGRAWQIALFSGLVIWLVLMLRALWPALQRRDSSRTLNVVDACGLSITDGMHFTKPEDYPGILADFERSFATLRSLPVDIWVTAHTQPWGRYRKYQASLELPRPADAFIDRQGYTAYIDSAEARVRRRVAEETANGK